METIKETVKKTSKTAVKRVLSNNGKKPSQGKRSVVKQTGTKKTLAGIQKSYLKNKPACRVTLRLPCAAAPEAKTVYVLGDFNEWKLYATPMKRLKNGDFSTTLELATGREYRFRYLIDEDRWENDWNADRYEKSPFGDSDNSVVVI